MKALHLITVGALGAAVLAGCGNDDDTGDKTAQSSAAPAYKVPELNAPPPEAPIDPASVTTHTPDGPYIGEWFAKLSLEEAANAGDSRVAGPFRLKLRRDGTYVAFQTLDGESRGRYAAASGNRLVFTRDEGCDPNFAGTGIYRWSLDGDTLRLKAVQRETGGCRGRTTALTSPRWKRR